MPDDDNTRNLWETAAGAVSGLLAGIFGLFDQLFALGGELLSVGGLDAILSGFYANAPTMFTMLSVARSEFQSVLTAVLPQSAWQMITVFVGVVFLLALAERLTSDFRARL
jgi:hypothetical protein